MLKKIFPFLLFTFAFLLLPFSASAAIEQGSLTSSPPQIYKDTTSINGLTIICTAFQTRTSQKFNVFYQNSVIDSYLTPTAKNQIIVDGKKVQAQINSPGTYTLFVNEILSPGAANSLCQVQYNISSMTTAEAQAAAAAAAAAAPIDCAGKPNTLPTAIGCIPTQLASFVAWFLGWAIGIAGGVAFLLMIWGAVQVILSSGDPEKLENGKGIITNALAGLLFIIFAVVILRLIGYNILQIPGFQ